MARYVQGSHRGLQQRVKTSEHSGFIFAPPFPFSCPLPKSTLQARPWGLSPPVQPHPPLWAHFLLWLLWLFFQQAPLFPASGPRAALWLSWTHSSITKKKKKIIFHDCIYIKVNNLMLYIKTFPLMWKFFFFLLILKEIKTFSWAPKCVVVLCLLGLIEALGLSRLFASAIPSAWNSPPPDSHTTYNLLVFMVLQKWHFFFFSERFPLVTLSELGPTPPLRHSSLFLSPALLFL